MDKWGKTTIIGLAIGLAFVIGGVVTTGQVALFWNLPSFFIICGGTIGSFVMAFSSNDLKRFGKVFKKAFMKDEMCAFANIPVHELDEMELNSVNDARVQS